MTRQQRPRYGINDLTEPAGIVLKSEAMSDADAAMGLADGRAFRRTAKGNIFRCKRVAIIRIARL
jgi:hypothetical protein